jgi:hypothetical protein
VAATRRNYEDFTMNDTFDAPVQSERERELEEKLGGRTILIALLGLFALLELAIIVQLVSQ